MENMESKKIWKKKEKKKKKKEKNIKKDRLR